ncbi:MAG TPA: DegT/DnrJ/EryC1/StrS family aminotransferase, partial [Blastocatellia bacterium]|nr:DegT/DnrJ/EryC1/StrS family aminotransferase [Blastocatellia bacterium]
AKKKYYHDCVGINSRLDSLQAAILRVKLPHLDRWADARRANAQRYRELFSAAESTSDRAVALPFEPTNGRHVYNQFVIRVRGRDALRAYLQDHGIGTEVYYPVPLHMQDCFTDLGYSEGDFPEAERAAREALSIPVYPELDEAAQKYVVENIASFYRFRSHEKVG